MDNDFSLEIEKLNESDILVNKLKFFSVYFDMYNVLMSTLTSYDKGIAETYSNFLKKIFELSIRCNNGVDKSNETEFFIRNFIALLRENPISKIGFIKPVLDNFKSNLEEFTNCSYVQKIDSLKIDFITKAEIIIILKKHLNVVFNKFIEIYGEEESAIIRLAILNDLTYLLPELVNDFKNFETLLKVKTKNIIVQKTINGEFHIDDIFDKFPPNSFDSFEEIEKKIFILCLPYVLSGYQKEEIESINSVVVEAFDELEISKVEFRVKLFTLSYRLFVLENSINKNNFDNNSRK